MLYYAVFGENGFGVYNDYFRAHETRKFIRKHNTKKFEDFKTAA